MPLAAITGTRQLTSFSYTGSGSVGIYGSAVALSTANYAYVGSGSLLVSGTASSTLEFDYVGVCNISVSGFSPSFIEMDYVGSGTVAITGASLISVNLAYSGSGSVGISGISAASYTTHFSQVGSGSILIAGVAQVSEGFTYVGNGAISVDGTSLVLQTSNFIYVGSGNTSIAGAAAEFETRNLSYIGGGLVSISGASSCVFDLEYVTTGSVYISGTGASQYIQSYMCVGSGSIAVNGFAGLFYYAILPTSQTPILYAVVNEAIDCTYIAEAWTDEDVLRKCWGIDGINGNLPHGFTQIAGPVQIGVSMLSLMGSGGYAIPYPSTIATMDIQQTTNTPPETANKQYLISLRMTFNSVLTVYIDLESTLRYPNIFNPITAGETDYVQYSPYRTFSDMRVSRIQELDGDGIPFRDVSIY